MKAILLYRRFWLIPLVVWTSVVFVSLAWNLAMIEHETEEISIVRARAALRIVEAVRLWNARHGGVYVLQNESTPPNPYLDGAERELETRDGRRLTLVNPAYMTRELAAPIEELAGFRVQLRSLHPINPGNVADPWERAALVAFESGEAERAEIVDEAGVAVLRYMAPLVARRACLECHATQGYQEGDIRGGISVSLPVSPVHELQQGHVRYVLIAHVLGWILLSGATIFALARWRHELLVVNRARREQAALVDERTAELRREVAERRQAETKLRLLIDASGNGIFGVGAGGECTFINPLALRLLGAAQAEEFLGRPILDIVAQDEARAEQFRDALRLGRSLQAEDVAFRRTDGRLFDVEIQLDPISGGGAVVNFADITCRKAAEAIVWRQANYDLLTGLPNRRMCQARLEDMLVQARRSQEIIALLFIDLDGFKAVNDTYGHAAGDFVLRATAERLQAAIRESDLAARLAGDEFVVILRHLAGEDYAGGVAAKLLEALSEPAPFGEHLLAVGASIGIALYPRDADMPEALIRCADQAMYQAKEAGKRAYRFYLAPREASDEAPSV